MSPSCHLEEMAYNKGCHLVAGVDEAGRGPLAGPVVAAACIIPRGLVIEKIDDSKKLTPKEREALYHTLIEHPDIDIGIASIDHQIIDQINILQASLQAMQDAVAALSSHPDYLLIDGPHVFNTDKRALGVIRGDSLSQSIAAASIVAKYKRDEMMLTYHEKWPMYGFDRHKGYPTPLHLSNLKQYGPCPIHRLSFKGVKTQLR